MLRKFSLAMITALSFFSVQAQDSTKSLVITGSIDGYYRYNFANAKSGNLNNFTSFTNSQNSFELGMASLRADHSFGKASATIDLGFGRRAEEFSYNDGETNAGKNGFITLAAVKQAFVTFAASSKVKFTLGKFATHIGYELADAYLNRNYSMDYMFSYGPFSHTGLKADITLGAKSALMLGVANTTDVVADGGTRKYALAQYSATTSNAKLKLYLNYQGSYGGSYSTTQFDVVAIGTISDKFNIGYNGTVQFTKPSGGSSDNWWGSAVYLNFDPTSVVGVTLRGEYFDNKKAVVSAPATSIFDVTLSPNFKYGNLTIIPELRVDAGKANVFEKNNGTPTKSTFTALLAATYHF
jgi:hypothetical protein